MHAQIVYTNALKKRQNTEGLDQLEVQQFRQLREILNTATFNKTN